MQTLYKHHIVDIFVFIDDTLISAQENGLITEPNTGRPAILTNSELITILLWDSLTEGHKTLKDIHSWIEREYSDCFPKLPSYRNFVAQCHRNWDNLLYLLQLTLSGYSCDASIRFMDSTMLPVCRWCRANRHKVADGVAAFGKNHQGWHLGFKLHAAINHKNSLVAAVFTPANTHDVKQIPKLVDSGIAVGDAGYNSQVMREKMWKERGCFVLAPPHHTQKKKLATGWQIALLKLRPKIEATFGCLKERMNLVTSFPRSVKGYFLHYIRILLGYQMRRAT